MVNNMDHTINERTNLKNIGGIILIAHYIPIHNFGGLHCMLQYFYWMENNVYLKDFQQNEIQFIHILLQQFQI